MGVQTDMVKPHPCDMPSSRAENSSNQSSLMSVASLRKGNSPGHCKEAKVCSGHAQIIMQPV